MWKWLKSRTAQGRIDDSRNGSLVLLAESLGRTADGLEHMASAVASKTPTVGLYETFHVQVPGYGNVDVVLYDLEVVPGTGTNPDGRRKLAGSIMDRESFLGMMSPGQIAATG